MKNSRQLQYVPTSTIIDTFGIYLTNEATGRKIGRKLMKFAIEQAIQQNKDYVWLKAMDSSQNAIRFYESLGFEICGTSRLNFEQMKTEYLGMVAMRRILH